MYQRILTKIIQLKVRAEQSGIPFISLVWALLIEIGDTILTSEDFLVIGDGDSIKSILTDNLLINTSHRDSRVFLGYKSSWV